MFANQMTSGGAVGGNPNNTCLALSVTALYASASAFSNAFCWYVGLRTVAMLEALKLTQWDCFSVDWI